MTNGKRKLTLMSRARHQAATRKKKRRRLAPLSKHV
jgi:hypothetical protein